MSVTQGFGERLAQERREKAARERRDIGQKDVAEAVGSSGPSVSRWEAGLGVPSDRMIGELARYFGVTPAWLRYGQEPRHAPAPELAAPKPSIIQKAHGQPPGTAKRAAEAAKGAPRKRA